MENKHNFMGIIIPVIVAVILLTVIPILTNMSTDCSHNIGQLNINPDFSSGDYFVDKGSYDYIDSATIIKDENLIPENIKKDVTIFGITGTLESGGASLDRIGIICFSFNLKKTSSTATLTYDINSEMLNKRFFTDGNGNWYLPEDVSVYHGDTYKGKANTTLTLFSGSGIVTGDVSFRVGTTPVALLLYYYQDDILRSGINTTGYLTIKWSSSGSGEVIPDKYHMEFIELPDNFFDDFPYYSHSLVDYWGKANFFPISYLGRTTLDIGWAIFDPD